MLRRLNKGLRLISRDIWSAVGVLVFNFLQPQHLVGVKIFVARRLVNSLGDRCIVSPGFRVFNGDKFRGGVECSFGYNFQVFDFSAVSISDKLLASHNITMIAGTHSLDESREYVPGPIKIGRNVWIGANVVIVGPCQIGDNCIVGANSYVTGNFGSNLIIGGSPAKIIRKTP